MSGQNISLLIARIPPKIMLAAISAMAVAAGIFVNMELEKSHRLLVDEQKKSTKKRLSQLLVAVKEIPEGSPVTADALRVQDVEEGTIPAGALHNAGEALGMEANFTIHTGDSILTQSLRMPVQAQGFSAKIKSGLRAITFPVDASTGVAGFLSPDCRIDIMLQSGSGADAKASPVLSDVQVVAVGQTYQKRAGAAEAQPVGSVTVAVQPSDGQKLINAMSSGKLYCLMRNQSDHTPLVVRDITPALPVQARPGAEPDLSALPFKLPVPHSVPEQAAAAKDQKANRLPSLHSIDVWSANKKDALAFPKDQAAP